jgi:N-acetylglutamate synthase-like GNAT family acetyltransferase
MTITLWQAIKGAIARKAAPRVPRVQAAPLAAFERDGLRMALQKVGLPCEDLEVPSGPLFWRFVNGDDVLVGFGGLELHGPDALLRSVVTLPPVRGAGFGRAIVAEIEQEARFYGCAAIYLLTRETGFFKRAGYATCSRTAVPAEVRASSQFSSPGSSDAEPMVKRLA